MDGVGVGVDDGVGVAVDVAVAVAVSVGVGVEVCCGTGAVISVAVGDGVGVCSESVGQDACFVTPERFAGLSLMRSISLSPETQGWSHTGQLNVRIDAASVVVASSKSNRKATEPSSAMKSI